MTPPAFQFSAADLKRLRRDLSPEAIAELSRALAVSGANRTQLGFPGERPLLTRIDALIREADRQGQVLPAEVRRWLEDRAAVARGNLRAVRHQREEMRRTTPTSGARSLVVSLTLRVLKRHGFKTGGSRAARVLAVALHARLEVSVGDEEGRLAVLQRERRRLAAFDPVDPQDRPTGRVSSDLEEWADAALSPRASTRSRRGISDGK